MRIIHGVHSEHKIEIDIEAFDSRYLPEIEEAIRGLLMDAEDMGIINTFEITKTI
jgi:hypothetical protein